MHDAIPLWKKLTIEIIRMANFLVNMINLYYETISKWHPNLFSKFIHILHLYK